MMIEYKSFKSYDNEEIFYIELGEGRPLVYVVGFGDTVEMAYPHALRWSERFHCVLFDHRGYGKTPYTPKGGVEESARDLHSLLCALNLDDVVLVGYSMGGAVAFSYFEQFGSERIGRLVLLDTNPKLINDSSWNLGLWQGLYTSQDYEHDLHVIEDNPPLFHLSFFVRASTPVSVGIPADFPDSGESPELPAAIPASFTSALKSTGTSFTTILSSGYIGTFKAGMTAASSIDVRIKARQRPKLTLRAISQRYMAMNSPLATITSIIYKRTDMAIFSR